VQFGPQRLRDPHGFVDRLLGGVGAVTADNDLLAHLLSRNVGCATRLTRRSIAPPARRQHTRDRAPKRGAVEHPRFTDEAWSRLDVVCKQRVLAAVLTQAHEDAVRAAAADEAAELVVLLLESADAGAGERSPQPTRSTGSSR
jgi:hypothetical protein